MTYKFLTPPDGISPGLEGFSSYSGCSSPKLTLHVYWYIVLVTTDYTLYFWMRTLYLNCACKSLVSEVHLTSPPKIYRGNMV